VNQQHVTHRWLKYKLWPALYRMLTGPYAELPVLQAYKVHILHHKQCTHTRMHNTRAQAY
jgi:hypothetical protein